MNGVVCMQRKKLGGIPFCSVSIVAAHYFEETLMLEWNLSFGESKVTVG